MGRSSAWLHEKLFQWQKQLYSLFIQQPLTNDSTYSIYHNELINQSVSNHLKFGQLIYLLVVTIPNTSALAVREVISLMEPI